MPVMSQVNRSQMQLISKSDLGFGSIKENRKSAEKLPLIVCLLMYLDGLFGCNLDGQSWYSRAGNKRYLQLRNQNQGCFCFFLENKACIPIVQH